MSNTVTTAERRAAERLEALDSVMTTDEVATLFKVKRQAVAAWVARDLLPYFRTPGGHMRYYRADVEALFNRCAEGLPVNETAAVDLLRWIVRLDTPEGAEDRRRVTLNEIITRARDALNEVTG